MAFTRAFSDVVEFCLDVTANLLYGKSRWPRLGPIPWSVVAVTMGMIGYWLGGWRLALLSGGTFVWIAVMGQWKWAMETLSVIVVAAPFSVMLGLLMGILAWRSPRFERVLNPILNIAQSLPHFAYMIPVVVFIGVGPKAGAIVTIIFSVPPMIPVPGLTSLATIQSQPLRARLAVACSTTFSVSASSVWSTASANGQTPGVFWRCFSRPWPCARPRCGWPGERAEPT